MFDRCGGSKVRFALPSIFFMLNVSPLTIDDQDRLARGGFDTPGRQSSSSIQGAVRERTKRRASSVIGAAERCKYGRPRVLLCGPMAGSIPFPTTFWLVCPYLDRAIGYAEGQNGVTALSRALIGKEDEYFRYNMLHSRLRMLLFSASERKYLARYRPSVYRALRMGGVGGSSYSFGDLSVKCLHLHTASMLALGSHPASSSLIDLIGDLTCDKICE